MTTYELAPGIHAVLDRVTVLAGACEARVDDHALSATSPGELRNLLSAELYAIFHAGTRNHRSDVPRPRTMRVPRFEKRLAEALPRPVTLVPARLLSSPGGSASGTEVLVELPDARVRVPVAMVPGAEGKHEGDSVLVRLPTARPALSPGFLAAGSVISSEEISKPEGSDVLRRVYVHVRRADRAPDVWRAVIDHLESLGERYMTKALSFPASYPRRDAVVVYLRTSDPSIHHDLARRISGMEGVGEDVSALAEYLAPGVSTALEPADDRLGRSGLSFGQHRCRVLAEALVDHRAGGGTRAELYRVLVRALVDARIDPTDPSVNLPRDTWRNP